MTQLQAAFVSEPLLTFGHNQSLDDPKNGLFLFGPLMDARKPAVMRVGVVGPPEGIAAYKQWVKRVTGFIPAARPDALHQIAYPGFEAVFRTPWPVDPVVELPISSADISRTLRLEDRHRAIYETVTLFDAAIRQKLRTDDAEVDLWFTVIPEEVHTLGRPLSKVPLADRIATERRMNAKIARRLRSQPSLFAEDMEQAAIYYYDLDFHNQLKARLLDTKAVVQVVRITSLGLPISGAGARRMQDTATIAWNLTTTSFFKAGGRPWKLKAIRDRVCYVGIVFKRDAQDPMGPSACCGAQMFLDSGDGLVFKGAIGNWYSAANREFHLSSEKAAELLGAVLREYHSIHGYYPSEVFLHSKTRFNNDEWDGFCSVTPIGVKIVGVRINRSTDVKAYRQSSLPVLRGTYLRLTERKGYLWASGYVPRLRTYAGREVPNPLSVEVTRGEADLDLVMTDVMGLTKVNFNACIYGDGLPVTLRFADSVGEILTAGPMGDLPPLPFRHYI